MSDSIRLEGSDSSPHMVRLARIISGALKAAIDAHGPITKELIGSATKRIVGQMAAERRTRLPIPVVTKDQFDKLERICAHIDGLMALSEEFGAHLAVLREDGHPEGWADIEVIERADTPVAVVHHYTVGAPPEEYRRKRDGKVVRLSDE